MSNHQNPGILNPSLPEIIFRHPVLEDANLVFDLMVRRDVSDYGEADSSMEDLLHDWSTIDLEKDAWLALSATGQAIAYADLLPWGGDIRFNDYLDPSLQTNAVFQELLARVEARLPDYAQERGLMGKIKMHAFTAHTNRRDWEYLQGAGFEPANYVTQMQIGLTNTQIPQPVWPAGVTVRSFVPGQDEEQVHQLIQSAFYQPDRQPTPLDEWRTRMLRPDIFEPELWFLAQAGSELVGACLCFTYPPSGWVRQLGVLSDWQGQGIGGALLRQAFLEFQRGGLENVGLTVESRRPDAYEFYVNLGMRPVRQYDELTKDVKGIGS